MIHITSIGAISLDLQFTAGEVENFHCREFEDSPVQTVNTVLILSNQ